MPTQQSLELLERYYEAFNAADSESMLACLADDVVHDINQSGREEGKAAFRAFLGRMSTAYRERLSDIALMVNKDGTRAAAEFIVHGEYLSADEGLPPANGQAYRLPAGAFFEITNGLIRRVTVYYNLSDWIAQVSEETSSL